MLSGRRTLGLIVAPMVVIACDSTAADPHERVGLYQEGRMETDLLREIGPPTRSRALKATTDNSDCKDFPGRQAIRELSYEIPSQGFDKRVRDLLDIGPSQIYVVCIDDADRIANILIVDIN